MSDSGAESGLPIKWGDAQQYHQDSEFPTTSDMDEQGDSTIVPRVTLLSMTSEPLKVIAAMCAMYEGRVVRSLSELSKEYVREKWNDVLATHLDTPLEAVQLHFLIEGVDRSFTHQLVRQRVGAAYAQESLRFAVVDDLKSATTLPPSLAGTKPADAVGIVVGYDYRSDVPQQWRDAWDDAISAIDRAYTKLVQSGMPAEEARGLLPHCTATRVHYVTNLRALSDHAGNRLCTQAQFHWRVVFAGIIDAIRNYNDPGRPDYSMEGWSNADMAWQFETIADSSLFRPICFKLGRCPFKASFDRDCSIREQVDGFAAHGVSSDSWDRGLTGDVPAPIRPIQPAQWLADPGAARRAH